MCATRAKMLLLEIPLHQCPLDWRSSRRRGRTQTAVAVTSLWELEPFRRKGIMKRYDARKAPNPRVRLQLDEQTGPGEHDNG